MSAKKSVAFEITFDTDKVRRPKPKLSSRTPRKTFSKTNSTTIPKRGRHVSDKATVTTVLRETVLAGGQSLKVCMYFRFTNSQDCMGKHYRRKCGCNCKCSQWAVSKNF